MGRVEGFFKPLPAVGCGLFLALLPVLLGLLAPLVVPRFILRSCYLAWLGKLTLSLFVLFDNFWAYFSVFCSLKLNWKKKKKHGKFYPFGCSFDMFSFAMIWGLCALLIVCKILVKVCSYKKNLYEA